MHPLKQHLCGISEILIVISRSYVVEYSKAAHHPKLLVIFDRCKYFRQVPEYGRPSSTYSPRSGLPPLTSRSFLAQSGGRMADQHQLQTSSQESASLQLLSPTFNYDVDQCFVNHVWVASCGLGVPWKQTMLAFIGKFIWQWYLYENNRPDSRVCQ